jgi:hypothetical protein
MWMVGMRQTTSATRTHDLSKSYIMLPELLFFSKLCSIFNKKVPNLVKHFAIFPLLLITAALYFKIAFCSANQ